MAIARFGEIEDKLYELQKACNRYKAIDPLADWVLFAVSRYIMSNKATHQFEINFVNYPTNMMECLIKECLNGDRSDTGILKTCARAFEKECGYEKV